MHPHAPIPAAKPHLSLNAFSAPSVSCEERNGGGERPSFLCGVANEVPSGLGEPPQPRSERLTSVQVGVCRSRIPPFARSLLRGLTGARRLGALLLRLRRPSGYGFQLRRTLRKCRAWHLGAGPTSLISDPSKIGKFNSTRRSPPCTQNKVTLIGFTWQRRRSSHQRQPQLHHSLAGNQEFLQEGRPVHLAHRMAPLRDLRQAQ